MIKKVIFTIFIGLCAAIKADAESFSPVTTAYIHGFTGKPSGALKMAQAFPNADNFYAPALPDTQPETGYGFNRLISYLSSLKNKNINRSHAYMGQGKDIQAIHTQVEQTIGEQSMILYGICRGGSAALNYVAKHNPKNLKAMVCEAMPGDLPATLHKTLCKVGLPTKADKTVFRLLFPAYSKNAVTPIQAIAKIANKNLPILLLHSREDTVIPFVQTLELYLAFKSNGFNNVHIVVLPGRHAYLLEESQQDYLTAVHSFYRHYGIAHDVKYATADMKSYDYDVNQAQQEIVAFYESLQEQQQKARNVLASFSPAGLVAMTVYKKVKGVSVSHVV